jgi:hypothetical protein
VITVLLLACVGLNVRAVPNQDLYQDDGQGAEFGQPLSFAVVGDVRPAMPGEERKRAVWPKAGEGVMRDISARVQEGKVRFVVLLGDLVRGSATAEWKGFSNAWSPLLSGTELPEDGASRVRSVPVAGNHERVGDPYLKGFGAAFQGVGADIGYNRIASWYAFDQTVKGTTWRFLVLDSNKATLGSRWAEQLAWIPKALDGDFDALLVFMHHPLVTLGTGHPGNEDNAPRELLATVEDATKIGALKAVFASHAHTNEVFLFNRLSELYINAGGGGAPADDLARWGHAAEAGIADIKLETTYDFALLREFDRWNAQEGFPAAVVDHARAQGEFKGFVGELDAHRFPLFGWWNVTLDGPSAEVGFRMLGPDQATARTVYVAQYDAKLGWKIGD